MDLELFPNEFTRIRVTRDSDANGLRLRVENLATGAKVWLDPMQLEAITHLTPSDFVSVFARTAFEEPHGEQPAAHDQMRHAHRKQRSSRSKP